ncbi:XRE family transcriptional regulator [Bacillus cereus]|uniref:XRE family transcriptional regulator n=2 Tax=Bacillus cereus group TaxID=86661 RepID=A0AAP8JX30_9BACI|nr:MULTISPECIES: helix-turn-helix transcriptional regulator [Bacillus]AZJ24120.1 XRE family transcriptional regulator [Bacillus wiedmannii bv. thuringiensis]MBY7114717.1 helix-turn-helix transcriptional regulator [Bacillus sp. 17RED48]MCU5413447.1 helix-turn-helix domain-containing protein [Bacillus wiedmannii]MDT3497013.1 helix-turn-helix domain-containing protein [Bacillus toyonensis]MED3541530.1 helix-turn-helix transcriptional regulator [Bacillus toyonensis]
MTVIRNIRESKGLSIQELSDASKIPLKTLYHIETGTKGVIENRAKVLADIFNEPIEKLFFATYYRARLE